MLPWVVVWEELVAWAVAVFFLASEAVGGSEKREWNRVQLLLCIAAGDIRQSSFLFLFCFQSDGVFLVYLLIQN